MKSGIELIADERQEQPEKHKHTIEDDVVKNKNKDLAVGAIALLTKTSVHSFPLHWNKDIVMKMLNKDYKNRLIIAGALIAAEIDRLNYLEKTDKNENV